MHYRCDIVAVTASHVQTRLHSHVRLKCSRVWPRGLQHISKVELVGLKKNPELNGCVGVVKDWDGLRMLVTVANVSKSVRPEKSSR